MPTLPQIPEFDNAADAATAIESYLRIVLNTKDIFHNLPFRFPQGREAFSHAHMHFSDIAGPCPRKPLMMVQAPEIPEEEQALGLFVSGHMHEMLIVACLDHGHPEEFEHQVEMPNIPDKTQAHVDLWWKRRNTVIEIKSASIGMRYTDEYPKQGHLLQAAGYAYYLSELTGIPQHAVVVYTFRDDPSQIDVFPVPEHYKDEMHLRVIDALRLLEEGRVPNIPSNFTPYKFPCVWFQKGGREKKCPMHSICWRDYQAPVVRPLDDATAQTKVDRLAAILRAIETTKDHMEDLREQKSAIEMQLAGMFDAAPNRMILPTNVEGKALKMQVRPGGVRYDLTMAMKRGWIPNEVLTRVERPRAGYSYVELVKVKEVPHAEPDAEDSSS